MKKNRRILRFHKIPPLLKFLIAVVAAAIVYFLVRHESVPVQVMSTWVCFSLVIMALSWTIMLTAHPREITELAKNQDFSRVFIFFIVLVTSFVGLVTIVLMLRELPGMGEKGYYYNLVLSIASIGSSWFLIHTIFTSHYAHLYYTCKTEENIDKAHRGGLEFPDQKSPEYLDFAYFSFVIGMTFQVSDVEVTSGIIRRQVLLHGLIAFLFNTIIVAVSINIIAGMVQK
jgi:uncharacterized membrane protein